MLTHTTICRVIYADTDAMGIAYHSNYLRWFEIGRTELFRSLGLPYREIEQKGIFLPVSEVHCKFMASAQYDDLLEIETSLDASVKGGMKFDYRIFSRKSSKNADKPIVKGFTKHACVDKNGRVVRPPDFLRSLIEHHL